MKKRPVPPLVVALLVGAFGVAIAFGQGAKWTAPEADAQKKNPVAVNTASLARGKSRYESTCVACHGATGKGDGPGAAGLPTHPANFAKGLPESDGALFWKITNGHAPMPTMASLPANERWCLVNYIRTLAK